MNPQIHFLTGFNAMQEIVHQTAVDHGFYEDGGATNDAERIALMHSELSEALEALRHGSPMDEKCPMYTNLEVELADCIIRVMDYAQFKGLNVAGAIIAKNAYNMGRPHKHGKKF